MYCRNGCENDVIISFNLISAYGPSTTPCYSMTRVLQYSTVHATV
nr:MAG TPA: hypothetical protein [Caudoviricetes sp.]